MSFNHFFLENVRRINLLSLSKTVTIAVEGFTGTKPESTVVSLALNLSVDSTIKSSLTGTVTYSLAPLVHWFLNVKSEFTLEKSPGDIAVSLCVENLNSR